MKNIEQELSRVEGVLESAAFLVSKGDAAREAHAEIVRAIVLLNEIRASEPVTSGGASPRRNASGSGFSDESQEINKVSRRLGRWVKRQDQLNARILNAYLKLERAGEPVITEEMLRAEFGDDVSFGTNFLQMRIIAQKNHGKIFDQYGDRITIWPPVEAAVRKYAQTVFGE